MQDNHSGTERHNLAVAALEKNLADVRSAAESLLLGYQAIESTHLLQQWFQDQVESLETMLQKSGFDAPISEAMPSDPFSALSKGDTVQDLRDTFDRALERLEDINCSLKSWAEDFAKEGERIEELRRDLQRKVLSAQGEVLDIVHKRRTPLREEGASTTSPKSSSVAHPASAWAEAANVTVPPTPGQLHGETTPVRPQSLGAIEVPDLDAPASNTGEEAKEKGKTSVAPTQESAGPNRSPRVAIEVPVSVESATRLWFATSENCSETGVFVATPFVVPSGTKVTLELLFPGSEPMPVIGEVAWTRESTGESGSSGMGVRLVEISPELDMHLKQILPTEPQKT